MDSIYFKQLTGYTAWVNKEVISWLRQLTDEQWEQEHQSSFPSIRQTVLHIVSAENVWIEFWRNNPAPVFLSGVFKGGRDELLDLWEKTTVELISFLHEYAPEDYSAPVVLKWNGETWQMAFWQTLVHFVNHATYHRGQLVTLLHQTGYTGLSSTDLAAFCRIVL